jgi:hypothetical protein
MIDWINGRGFKKLGPIDPYGAAALMQLGLARYKSEREDNEPVA